MTKSPPQTDPAVIRRNRRQIRIWLYTVCLLIFAMIIVGGATRLTDSGLSITEWLPLLGAIPPLSEADWLAAFAKYKQIPEYTELNKGMSLSAFKFIYWWEWAHRFLGRFIGVAFFVPVVYFWLRGRVEPWLMPRLLVMFVLGGLQGAVGWWMVASGLVERTDVSQYRLAAHLILACLIFAYMAWVAAGMASKREILVKQTGGVVIGGWVVFAVTMIQIYLGALVGRSRRWVVIQHLAFNGRSGDSGADIRYRPVVAGGIRRSQNRPVQSSPWADICCWRSGLCSSY